MPLSTCQTKWMLSSDLLIELLTDNFIRRSNYPTPPILGISSDWTHNIEHPEVIRGILTWLVSQAYCLQRNPSSPDTCFTAMGWYNDIAIHRFSQKLLAAPLAIQHAIDELKAMRPFVQAQVKLSKEYSNGAVKLGRAYKNQNLGHGRGCAHPDYANRLLRYARAAQMMDVKILQVPHDTLTSWSTGDYTQCVAAAFESIPASDILVNSDMLNVSTPRYRSALETGEWIVITSSPDGMRMIEASNVQPIRTAKWPEISSQEAKEILEYGMPSQIERASSTFWNTLH